MAKSTTVTVFPSGITTRNVRASGGPAAFHHHREDLLFLFARNVLHRPAEPGQTNKKLSDCFDARERK
jgi:hypothetical protein